MRKVFRYISLAAFALAAMTFVSCDKDDTTTVPGKDTVYFPIGDKIQIHPLGDELHVSFTSDVDWKVAAPDWVTFMPKNGAKGTTNITIKVEACLKSAIDKDKREDLVKFSDTNGSSLKIVTFSQDAAYMNIKADNGSDSECQFKWKKDQISTYRIETNIEYDIEFDEKDVFELVEEDKKFTLKTLDHNFGVEDYKSLLKIVPVRNANVDIDSENKNKLTKTLDVSQDHLIFIVTENSQLLPEDKEKLTSDLILDGYSELGRDYVELSTDSCVTEAGHVIEKEFAVIAEVDENNNRIVKWAPDEFADKNIGYTIVDDHEDYRDYAGRKVVVTPCVVSLKKPNPSLEPKKYVLPIQITDSDVQGYEDAVRYVTLVQKPYVFEIEGNPASIDFENQGGEATLTLKTTGPWKLDTTKFPAWFKLVRRDGIDEFEGLGPVSFDVVVEAQNYDFEQLDALLPLSTAGLNNDISIDMPISQARFAFDIEPDPELLRMSRMDLDEKLLHVQASGTWTVSVEDKISGDSEQWLNIDQNLSVDPSTPNPSGIYDYTIFPKEVNPHEDKDRCKIFTFISTYHQQNNTSNRWKVDQYVKSFEVVQERLVCRIVNSAQDSSEFTPQNYLAYSADNTQTLRLECSAPWTIESKPSWISFYDADGGDKEITSGDGVKYKNLLMKADTNKGTSSYRTGSVVFKADADGNGSYERSMNFNVSQDKFVFTIDAKDSYSFPAINPEPILFSLELTNDVDHDPKFPKWANLKEVSSERGEKTTVYRYSISPSNIDKLNEGYTESAEISNALDEVNKHTIQLYQEAYYFKVSKNKLTEFTELTPEPQTFTVTCSGGTDKYSVDPDSDCKEWLTVSRSGDTWTAKANNNVTDNRSGTIKVSLTDDNMSIDHTYSIKVSQRDFVFSVDSTSVTAGVLDNLIHSVIVSSSGEWTASSSNSNMVTLTPTSGNGKRNGETLKMEVTKNYTDQPRSATITIKSQDANKQETISISQPKYEFTVSGDNTEKVGSAEVTFTRSVKCSDPTKWEVISTDNTNFSCKKSTDNKSFTVSVTSNEGEGKKETSPRNATITVRTTDDSNREFKIEVSQDAFKPKTK